MNIDLQNLKTIRSDSDSKVNMTNSNNFVSKEMLASLQNTFDNMRNKSSIYESCLWIESNQNLLANKNRINTRSYPMKSIVLADLGTDTFGYEFCFEHPCIVLYNEYKKVFVVPCTSQPARRDRNGNLYPGQLEGDVSDGFAKRTTILLNEAKFIDKTRIKRSFGKVENELFNEIYDKVFELIFESKSYKLNTVQSLKDQAENNLSELQQKYELLQEELSIIQQENKILKEELNAAKLVAATEVSDSE